MRHDGIRRPIDAALYAAVAGFLVFFFYVGVSYASRVIAAEQDFEAAKYRSKFEGWDTSPYCYGTAGIGQEYPVGERQ